EDTILSQVLLEMNVRKLYQLLDTVLDERERHIVRLRYGLGGGKEYTQREIAQELGISRSYVSRIEKRALQKLSEGFSEEDRDF
ncbi:MAG: sigma-70 family RNA polymerase sigma factor, partial [Clostridia bacterium]|nr:sigma-70 family RNA polymerase sigma factor [Clostridia bacterium]